MNIRVLLLYVGASISAAGSLIHLAAIIGGPAWYRYFGAPKSVVQSAEQGTLLAPASTFCIALGMAICAAYALSAAGRLPRLPLLRPFLLTVGALCLLRGLVVVPLWVTNPAVRNPFNAIASLIWAVAGISFVIGVLLHERAGEGP